MGLTREARRARLVRRQALLAEVERVNAMRGLADALGEEARSRALAERSRALAAGSAIVGGAALAEALTQRAAFAGALAGLAGDADAARVEAEAQAAWQAEALGRVQDRARRLSERAAAAESALADVRERAAAGMAVHHRPRSLARMVHGPDQPAHSHPQKGS